MILPSIGVDRESDEKSDANSLKEKGWIMHIKMRLIPSFQVKRKHSWQSCSIVHAKLMFLAQAIDNRNRPNSNLPNSMSYLA